jgi:hypothetical protein
MGRSQPDEHHITISYIDSSVKRLLAFLRPSLTTMALFERCARRSALFAERVFGVTELLERILKFCRPIDVVRFEMANITPTINAVIGDYKWQQYAGLELDLTKYSLPLEGALEENGISITKCACRFSPENTDEAFFCLLIKPVSDRTDFREKWQQLGTRERTMFIVQPPVYKLDFFISCCSHTRTGSAAEAGKPLVSLHDARGMNVGRVLLQLATLQADHSQCPHAFAFERDKDGRVWPR